MSDHGCSIVIRGTGSYSPEKVLTNDDLSKIVDTTDEWIVSRTGIRERRIAGDDQATSDLAIVAAERAIEAAGVDRDEIDVLIVATLTPDMLFPSTACILQDKLGLREIPSFDIDAACSGFLYALEVGSAMLRGNRNYRNVLIVGAEKLSSIIDWRDRSTCVLFGDAAGAVILSRSDQPGTGILAIQNRASGRSADLIHMPAGGSRIPSSAESVSGRLHFLRMSGREVFKVAVRAMVQSATNILGECGLTTDDVEVVIPHQANMRIIESVAQHLKVPLERFPNNLALYGNTSAASVPLALDEAVRAGKVQKGDHVLLIAFGAGLTWGASLIEWN